MRQSFSRTGTAPPNLRKTAWQKPQNLEESLAAMLRQNGIPDARVQVEMNIAEDNSIEIEQVTVACRDAAAAGQLLTDCLGKEVNIHVETDS